MFAIELIEEDLQLNNEDGEIIACDEGDDPGPDDDDDPEGDGMKFHQCSGLQWGYCIERKGHTGKHKCYKCGGEFEDDDD